MRMRDAERESFWRWIEARRKEPVVYGHFDCCTLVRDYLVAFHGHADEMADFAGRYEDHIGAMALIDAAGGLQVLVEARLGPMLARERAEAGAIAIGDFGHGEALALCTGHNVLAPTARGLRGFSLSRVQGCWLP